MLSTAIQRRNRNSSSLPTHNVDPTSSPLENKRSRKKRRRRRKHPNDDEPFIVTFFKVGGVLAFACLVAYGLYNISSFGLKSLQRLSSTNSHLNEEDLWREETIEKKPPKSNVFPTFDLAEDSRFDVWGISDILSTAGLTPENSKINNFKNFSLRSAEIIDDFEFLCGGKNAAREVMQRSIYTFHPHNQTQTPDSNNHDDTTTEFLKGIPQSIKHTARRILQVIQDKEPLHISFSGSSAVAGHGNKFEDTFPSIMTGALSGLLESLGVKEVVVRNAAIADISTFPYGWCLKNYFGINADVVSWDSGMSGRQDTVEAFEAFLRNAMVMKKNPMIIVREANSDVMMRKDLLQKYVNIGALKDPIVIDMNLAAQPFLGLTDEITPKGFENWEEFDSAPPGALKKIRTDLTSKQHEFIGWILTMHFTTAAQIVFAQLTGFDVLEEQGMAQQKDKKYYELPIPQSFNVSLDEPSKALSLLHGIPMGKRAGDSDNSNNNGKWYMNPIQCRTSFEPIVGELLQDIIASGTNNGPDDLMFPKGPMQYNYGWVMDLGPEAKKVERVLKPFELDYRYRKVAYFGVPPSGTLKLFLPYEDGESVAMNERTLEKNPVEKFNYHNASSFFLNIIVCAANENWGDKQCKMNLDLEFIIGGEKVTEIHYIDAMGVSYLGKQICVIVPVPSNSSLTTKEIMKIEEERNNKNEPGNEEIRRNLEQLNPIGISLEITVTGRVMWDDGPCSVSHVIWEQKRASFESIPK